MSATGTPNPSLSEKLICWEKINLMFCGDAMPSMEGFEPRPRIARETLSVFYQKKQHGVPPSKFLNDNYGFGGRAPVIKPRRKPCYK